MAGAARPVLMQEYLARMREKLRLVVPGDDDHGLVSELLRCLRLARADYTRFFRGLGSGEIGDADEFPGEVAALGKWMDRYRARLACEDAHPEGAALARTRRARMEGVNPRYVLRNHLAQGAIERAERGDYTEIDRLRRALSDPYSARPEFRDYEARPPAWSREIVVSCSS